MGGFMVYEENGSYHTLRPEELEDLLKHGKINITEKEIRDKGRGDALSKGLILIQTGWFILQCIARRVERLPITELELVTLAFGVLNFVTYTLWWNKPLNVDCPVRVYKKEQSEKGKGEGEGGEGGAGTSLTRDTGGGEGKSLLPIIIATDIQAGKIKAKALVQRTVHGATTIVYNTPGSIRKAPGATGQVLQGYVAEYRWRIIWHLLAAVLFPVSVPFFAGRHVFYLSIRLIGYDVSHDDIIQKGAKRVPTFYAGELTKENFTFPGLAATVIATVFGGIHCVAWSFKFPSRVEKLLWIISSLVITSGPAAVFILGLWADAWRPEILVSYIPIIITFAILPFCYMIGRVVLLVLPFLSLRSLPAEGYQTVQWTTFIPHV
jgi:hypothetical protein